MLCPTCPAGLPTNVPTCLILTLPACLPARLPAVGTSTGGLLAVALGIRKMAIEECEFIYKVLGRKVFSSKAPAKEPQAEGWMEVRRACALAVQHSAVQCTAVQCSVPVRVPVCQRQCLPRIVDLWRPADRSAQSRAPLPACSCLPASCLPLPIPACFCHLLPAVVLPHFPEQDLPRAGSRGGLQARCIRLR